MPDPYAQAAYGGGLGVVPFGGAPNGYGAAPNGYGGGYGGGGGYY